MDESAESTETAVRARATARGTETLTNQCSRARLARYSFRPAPPRQLYTRPDQACVSPSVYKLWHARRAFLFTGRPRLVSLDAGHASNHEQLAQTEKKKNNKKR
jgi:hypothetical protein